MLGSYPEHICNGLSSLVANFVPLKVHACNAGVVLPEIKNKDTVSGAANSAQNAWNQAQNKRTNHAVELEQFFEIFPMSCVVKMVGR